MIGIATFKLLDICTNIKQSGCNGDAVLFYFWLSTHSIYEIIFMNWVIVQLFSAITQNV